MTLNATFKWTTLVSYEILLQRQDGNFCVPSLWQYTPISYITVVLHICSLWTFQNSIRKIIWNLSVSALSQLWVVLRNCVPLGVGNFKLVFEGNLLLQCKYFYFLSLYVDVSDNKNNNGCQSCVLCTLNRTDVAKWIKNGATDLWHRQHHWKECIRNFIKNTQWQRI